jgi:hypothetical protein
MTALEVRYNGSLPNKYSYVTFDIMLAPDPMSEKVLRKIFWLIVHSIVGTLGSSFLTTNGGESKWSLSILTALIILIVSFGTWLSLFLLQFQLFFFLGAGVVGSVGRYDICGCARECKMRSLNENFSFLSFMEKIILSCSA